MPGWSKYEIEEADPLTMQRFLYFDDLEREVAEGIQRRELAERDW